MEVVYNFLHEHPSDHISIEFYFPPLSSLQDNFLVIWMRFHKFNTVVQRIIGKDSLFDSNRLKIILDAMYTEHEDAFYMYSVPYENAYTGDRVFLDKVNLSNILNVMYNEREIWEMRED